MKTVFGVNSATPINKKLKNGYTMYDWVMRQKGFPAFCMRTLCGADKITATASAATSYRQPRRQIALVLFLWQQSPSVPSGRNNGLPTVLLP